MEIKQIRNIDIDVTKEEIAKEFITSYKWQHSLIDTNEYVKEMAKSVAIICGFICSIGVPLLLCLYYFVREDYITSLIFLMLISIASIVGIKLVVEDCIDIDFKYLNQKYNRFLELCDILQYKFVTNDIATILNTDEIVNISLRLRMLRAVMNQNVTIHKDAGNNMYVYCNDTKCTYSLGMKWSKAYNGQYILQIGIDDVHLESISVEPEVLRKSNEKYEVVYTSDMLDIGLCVKTKKNSLPELIRCSAKFDDSSLYYGSVEEVQWYHSGIFLTEQEWDVRTYKKSTNEIIEVLGLDKIKEENSIDPDNLLEEMLKAWGPL